MTATRGRHPLLALLLLAPACTVTAGPPPTSGREVPDGGAAEGEPDPGQEPAASPDAAPDPCVAPDLIELGAAASGSVSDGSLVQVNFAVDGEPQARLQLRAADQPITARLYDFYESWGELIGPGTIFDCEVRLWLKHPTGDGTFEEYTARTGQLEVLEIQLAEPASISFKMTPLELVRVRLLDGGRDYEEHPEACTRKLNSDGAVIELPLAQAQG
ncbi:MAG TPA: hypothetical protein VKZ63_12575 [Kofleriaceae bacterium]|nr:hypothetical protein [Kofleriaceae bacterium]